MHTLPALDALDPFLSSQWRESATPWILERSNRPFITISREAGSGGASLARMLARKLNAESKDGVPWRVFEGNLISAMLAENGHPAWTARFLPERPVPEFRAWVGEFVGLHPNIWSLIEKANQMMRQLAVSGNVILVGRGANIATAGMDMGVHVRLVAPAADRAAYLAKRYNIPEREALEHNAKCDNDRRRYVSTVFGVDDRDQKSYDLVVNTSKMTLEAATNLVGNLVSQRRAKR